MSTRTTRFNGKASTAAGFWCICRPKGPTTARRPRVRWPSAEENYLDKAVSDRVLVLFGIGDGGGGPGEEHLERLARERNLAGLPPVVQEPSSVFFRAAEPERRQVCRLARRAVSGKAPGHADHAGTEQAGQPQAGNRPARVRAVLCSGRGGLSDGGALDRIWKEMLLLQFHDILPGSSITRVYDESLPRYAALLAEVAALDRRRRPGVARRRHSARQS